MTRAGRLAACASALLVACDPMLVGECIVAEDCPSDTRCIEGLCLAATPDAGEDVAWSVRIDSPEAEAVVGGTFVPVTLRFEGPRMPEALRLRVNPPGGESLVLAAIQEADVHVVELPLGQSRWTTGPLELVPVLHVDGRSIEGAPVRILVDKTAPVANLRLAYPPRPAGHVATDAFVRNERVVVEAEVSDELAGLAGPPTLTFPGAAPLEGSASGGLWRFEIDARALPLDALEDDVTATLSATDRVGNRVQQTRAVRITRRAWTWTKPGTSRVSAAPVVYGLDGRRVIAVADEDGVVYARDRLTGEALWSHDLASEVVGHVTAGERTLFAVTRAGYAYWLDATPAPDAALPAESPRRVFRCPRDPSDPLDGDLQAPVGGPALGWTKATSGGDEVDDETIFFATGRQLRMMRRSLFETRSDSTTARGCTKSIEFGATARLSDVAPIIAPDGAIYIGVGNVVHRVEVARNGDGDASLELAWKESAFDARSAVTGPLAVFAHGSGFALLAATAAGSARAFDAGRSALWTLNGTIAIRGGPVSSSTHTWMLTQTGPNDRSRLLRTTLAGANGGPGSNLQLDARALAANAAPLVTVDGRVIAAAGPRISLLTSNGKLEWAFDTRPNGTGAATVLVDRVSPTLACDGLLYVVANGPDGAEVHALVTDSPGLASPNGSTSVTWPKSMRDGRNTGNALAPFGGECTD